MTAIAKHHDKVILFMFKQNWQLAQNMYEVGQGRLSDSNCTKSNGHLSFVYNGGRAFQENALLSLGQGVAI